MTEFDIESYHAEEYGVDVPTYRAFKARIEMIVHECHFQSHLHGEEEPTPYEYVANEAFFAGYAAGRDAGINLMIDGLDIRERWEELVKEEKEKAEQKRIDEIVRRVKEGNKERVDIE